MAKLVRKAKKEVLEPNYLPNTRRIASLAASKKAAKIKGYDLSSLTLIADSFVVCSATSDPHMKAVLTAVIEGMKEVGVSPRRIEGTHKDGWVIVDYSDIILHVFREESRLFYDLDSLWADALELDLALE